MNTKQINDFVVRPIINSSKDKFIRGSDLIPECYSNIIIWGGKGKGKSTLVYRLMQNVAHRCNVVVFSSTVNNDPTYKKMIKMLKDKKKCNVEVFDHFIDDESGMNRLSEFRKLLQQKYDNEDDIVEQGTVNVETVEDKEKPKEQIIDPKLIYGYVNFGDPPAPEPEPEPEPEPKKPKITKRRPKTAEFIFIMDDLSSDLRDKAVYKLMNTNRHFKMKTITCIHGLTDLSPNALQNVDIILALPDLPEEKIKNLQEKIGLTFKNDSRHNNVLWNAYNDATEKPFNFLYIDRNSGNLRKNFNERIII